MKKLSILILMVFGYFSNAVAVEGVNLGVSLTAGVFEVDGAKEEFKGAHVGTASPGDIKKTTAGEDVAEGLFAIGSIFAEYEVNDVFAVGLDYVPHSLDSETNENAQTDGGSSVTNTVQVDFENLTTLYLTLINFLNLKICLKEIFYKNCQIVLKRVKIKLLQNYLLDLP